MVLAKDELPVYFKETSGNLRQAKFCLKPVHTQAPRTEKRADSINVQVVRGKTTTFIHLEEDEAKKVQQHADFALKKLQRIHKSVIWNFMIGRSFVDKIQKTGKTGADEINIDKDENVEFGANNPKSWSDESTDFIKSILKASEFNFDGFVVLFCVENAGNGDVDYDEMAWELEKCLTYHYIASKSQLITNEEAIMARRGLDPVSRKTKTPGRKKSGFCVYLAYQLLDSITHDQMVGESINKFIDVHAKKKQLLAMLTEAKLQPQTDEHIRKSIKEIREFMSKDQLDLVFKLKELKDQQSIDMLLQFMQVLRNGRNSSNSSFVGLPQFLSFLNMEDGGGGGGGGGNRMSPRVNGNRGSTLPRPASSTTGRHSRKPSISSQTISISSRSTTPDHARTGRMSSSAGNHRVESSLASIPSSGSGSSTPETLRRGDQRNHGAPSKPEVRNGKNSRLPQRTQSLRTPAPAPRTSQRSSSQTTPRLDRSSRAQPSRNGRDSVRGTNGQSSRTGSATPSISSIASSPSRRSSRGTPTPTGKLITREDLRRMNKSYPSTKKKPTATSFSRATIPM